MQIVARVVHVSSGLLKETKSKKRGAKAIH